MSRKETQQYLPAPEPQEPNIGDIANDYVLEQEKKYLKRLKKVADFFEGAWAYANGLCWMRQREISRQNYSDELDRMDPRGKWAVESGDCPPKKKKVDWNDL